MTLPTATINSVTARAYRWASQLWHNTVKLGVLVMIAAGSYGLTQVGCRNDAITYAKARNPGASCNAVHTCSWFCHDDPDIAICHVNDKSYQCQTDWDSYQADERATCTLLP